MGTLRGQIIRLAYLRPELQGVLLPLLRTAGAVKVQIDAKASRELRKKFPGEGAIISGVFKSSIPLYRAVDGGEMHRILKTKKVEGGFFSVTPERSGGASWGADKQEVIKFGLNWQSRGRLGGKLFLLETDGNGHPFIHLDQSSVDLSQGDHVTTIDATSCSTGLGCSLIVAMASIKSVQEIQPGGHLADIPGPELAQLAKGEAETPRAREVYWAGSLLEVPKVLLRSLGRHTLTDAEVKALLKRPGWPPTRTDWRFDDARAMASAYRGQALVPDDALILLHGVAEVGDTHGDVFDLSTVGLKNVEYLDPKKKRWVNVWSSIKPVATRLR